MKWYNTLARERIEGKMFTIGIPEGLLFGVVLISFSRRLFKLEQRFPMIPWKNATTFVAGLITGFETIRLVGDGWFGAALALGIISFAALYGSTVYRKEKTRKRGAKKNGCASFSINIIYLMLAVSALQFVSAGLLVHAIWAGTYCALGLRGKVSDLWKERKQKSK